jgi:hypothetical protein
MYGIPHVLLLSLGKHQAPVVPRPAGSPGLYLAPHPSTAGLRAGRHHDVTGFDGRFNTIVDSGLFLSLRVQGRDC